MGHGQIRGQANKGQANKGQANKGQVSIKSGMNP